MGQSIVSFVGSTLDNAKMGPIQRRVLALITFAYFFDVIDFIILGSLVPDLIRSGFAAPAQVGAIGTAQFFGIFIGTKGEFTDRYGRKRVLQAAILLYSAVTILAALSPNFGWLIAGRFVAGIGLGAAQPLCFSYAAEFAPKAIRGRVIAFMQFVGGACVWPIGTAFALGFRDSFGWWGVWIFVGIAGLVVFLFSFALPESPRWLVTHGKGEQALSLLSHGPRPAQGTARPRRDHRYPQRSHWRRVPSLPPAHHRRDDLLFAFFTAALGLGG
jgi:MFS transporter, putative metabolite:H+ symporter